VPADMVLQSSNLTCCDENYIKVHELVVKEDGGTPKVTSKYEILKEPPKNMIVSTVEIVH